jgi:hypothetical protein
MSLRTEPRLAKESAVRIFGLDSKGHAVSQPATTMDISKHGARIAGVNCWDHPGETIGIRYGMEKARYRVVWVGLPGTPVESQIGVQCVEYGKYIWDGPTADEKHEVSLSVTPAPARSRGKQVGLAPAEHSFTDHRRHDQRFIVNGTANVHEVGKHVPQWTALHDLSMGGCYLETTAPLPVDSRVDLAIQVGDVKIDVRGLVTVKHPLVGMGIKFSELSPLNRDRLYHLIGSLDRAEAQATGGAY